MKLWTGVQPTALSVLSATAFPALICAPGLSCLAGHGLGEGDAAAGRARV